MISQQRFGLSDVAFPSAKAKEASLEHHLAGHGAVQPQLLSVLSP
jgi:hypothetical protein